MKARRWWAWPLVPVYAAGLAVKDGLRGVGVLPTRRLGWPVVSVGSLSAGGAGKTPVVIALAELLNARGWDVDVLSRGYGRDDSSKESAEQVMPGIEGAAARFGDEPVLIARRTGVSVWVGADRFLAGTSAEDFAGQQRWKVLSETAEGVKEAGPFRGVHLLDDGFQHRRLGRALDVVLVTAEDLEDVLLPAGNRRESLRALRRADVVVLREEERAGIEQRVRRWMRNDVRIWVVRRRLSLGAPKNAETWGRVVAFCAIARPEGFSAMLRAGGCEVVNTVAFADHHRYGASDVERLVRVARECGAAGFITTEKDAVKLTAAMRERLEAVGPMRVAALHVTFLDEAQVMRDLEERLG